MFQQFKNDGDWCDRLGFTLCAGAIIFFFFAMPWLLQMSKRAIGESAVAGIGILGTLIYFYFRH